MTKKIGIVGCGGIGKTTLAKAVEKTLEHDHEVIIIDPSGLHDNIPAPIEPLSESIVSARLLPPVEFTPPLTRAERRKLERENKRKRK